MKDDLLRTCARALDDQAQGASEAASFTRARVLASLHQSRVRRRTRLAFALPLAASFAAATAWGTVSGRAPEVFRSVAEALGFGPRSPAPLPAQSRSLPNRPAEAPTPKASPSADSAAVSTSASSEQATAAPLREAPSEPVSGKLSNARGRAASVVASDPAHSLYLAAHGAHFVAQDFTRALSAWDAYLQAAPSGRFAPEARYNRALCLAHLGRHSEASAALAPFADAPEGSYRKDEATALRSALLR